MAKNGFRGQIDGAFLEVFVFKISYYTPPWYRNKSEKKMRKNGNSVSIAVKTNPMIYPMIYQIGSNLFKLMTNFRSI